tara:strand:+ start:1145 stop:1708 length:564 start_codon:yes stop_codon:yes gene_type:complete
LQEKIWGEVVKIKNSLSKPRKLALCGFMGAGKTSVFNRLRHEKYDHNYFFADSDALILKSMGYPSIKEIVGKLGWSKFRELEQQIISDLVRGESSLVLSLGGGSLNNSIMRMFSEEGVVLVWLKAGFEDLLLRASLNQGGRPLLKEKTRGELLELYQERRKYYSEADIIIDNKSLEEAVDIIKGYLE